MTYFSHTWEVEVRDEIAAEFTLPDGTVDDNLAGLHEVRARRAERERLKTPDDAARELDSEQRELEINGWRLIRRGKGRSAA